MNRSRRVASCHAVLVAGAAIMAIAQGRVAHAAVTLQPTSVQVANPGDPARVCVLLSTDNEQVAGLMNDIRWDGNCATLTGQDRCVKAGSHGKQVHADTEKQSDFMARVLVLSLSDVDVIPDGPVYCCDFQAEAEPGSCCSVSLINVGASDPGGKALRASGGSAQICTSGSGSQPGRGGLGGGGGGPLSASNDPAPMPGGGGGQPAPAPQAPAGGGGAPPAQVLQGGGARPGEPAGVAVGEPTPPAAVPPTALAAAAPPTAAAAAAPPTAMAPPLPPPTEAATSAPTEAATMVPTPATSPAAPATKPPTAAAAATKPPAAPKQAVPAAPAAEESSWFGCQIGGPVSGAPLVGLGILALLGMIARRGRR